MHAPLCATSSLAIRLEGSIFGGPYTFDGTYFVWRAIYSEGSTLGGLFLYFFVFLSFSLSPWLDQLSFRYQMVYAIYLEIITTRVPSERLLRNKQ